MQTQTHNKNTKVLIIGAGPSGLMMACQLAIHQVSFRIIDIKKHPSTYSGALIVHARSVEIFNQMGISGKVLEEAIIANNLRIIFNGKKTVQISLKDIGKGLTKFPNLYLIEQSKTELLLIDFISATGHFVERETELTSFTQNETGVNSVLKLPDGKEEKVNSQYLIAADGGDSIVREQLKISFVGKRHPVSLFIIDCKAELDLPSDEMCFSFSDASTSGFFPMKEDRKRIDGVIPKELEGRNHITFNEIEKNFAERLRMKIRLYNPEWFSVSHSNQRYALSYHQNRCFLIGDAAHTFTPVGAQGMNTGMQDAFNLAWKLAIVIQRKAKIALLNTYSDERQNIAKKTVLSTGKIYNLVTSQNIITKTFRLYMLPYLMKWILPLMEKQKKIRGFCFRAISEIGIQYRESPLSHNASLGHFPSCAPKPGDRLPYLFYIIDGAEVNIQEKVKGISFHLFIFSKETLPDEIIMVAEKYKNIISIETIPYTSGTITLYERIGIKNTGYFLIRPDMYIAYRSSRPDTGHFERYLQKFLK